MRTLDELTADDLVEQFEQLDGWESRFRHLLDLGDQVPALDETDRTDENRIAGCQSQVWLKAWSTNEDPVRFRFVANSDARLVTGLIAVLMVVYDGQTPEHVLVTDATAVLDRLGLEEHLSPTRRNGLHAMLEQIRGRAAAALNDPG